MESHSIWPSEVGMNPTLHQSIHSSPLENHFSIYFINSSIYFQFILLFIQFFLSIFLFFGYQTKKITFLLWFFISSFHSRMEIFLDISDQLLRLLLFFNILSNWSCKFSIDHNLLSMNTYHFYSSPSLSFNNNNNNINTNINNNNNNNNNNLNYYSENNLINNINNNNNLINNNKNDFVDDNLIKKKRRKSYEIISRICLIIQIFVAHFLFAYSISDFSFRNSSSFSTLSFVFFFILICFSLLFIYLI